MKNVRKVKSYIVKYVIRSNISLYKKKIKKLFVSNTTIKSLDKIDARKIWPNNKEKKKLSHMLIKMLEKTLIQKY